MRNRETILKYKKITFIKARQNNNLNLLQEIIHKLNS